MCNFFYLYLNIIYYDIYNRHDFPLNNYFNFYIDLITIIIIIYN